MASRPWRVAPVGLVLGLGLAISGLPAWGAECPAAQVHPRFLRPTSGQTVRVGAGAPVKIDGDIARPAGCTLPGLSSVIVYFQRQTPAASGQTTQGAGRVEVPLQAGKWRAEKVLPAGGYLLQAELARSGEGGAKFGKEEKIGITVQEITLNPNATKKAPLPKVPAPK